MNGDNLYPVDALRTLASLDEPGLPAFDRDDLVAREQHPGRADPCIRADRRRRDGYLRGIVEKPAA